MHDHLRDLGRNVAQDSLPRRLWCWTENVIDNLLEQSSAISVRGIRMLLSEYNDDDDDAYDGIHMRRLQLLDTEDVLLERIWKMIKSPNLIWLRWNKCSHSSLPPWIQMKNLRVLQVSGGALKTLWEGQSQAPLLLRELHILAPLSNIPKAIGQLKHLERVVISFSSSSGQVDFEKLPEEFCHMQSLKTLVLKCSKLKTLPDSFGNLTNLQHINLSGCRNLERLPNSFGNLIKLKYLDLSLCCNLTIETFGNISTLEYIDLSDCTKIEVLPQQVVYQRSLEKLDLSDKNLKELPSAIGELSDLEVLILGSPVLDTLPPSIGDLRNLKDLMLDHCKKLTCLPASVGLLNQLTRLRVRDCPLRELLSGERETFPTLSNLDSSFHKCMPRLQYFRMSKTEIPEVSFAEGICPNLHHLYIQNCNHLVKVGILPNTLIKLELDRCSNLRKIEGLSGLVELEMLHIWRCGEVEELAGIETLVSLEELWAR